jgi:hypothetical protein
MQRFMAILVFYRGMDIKLFGSSVGRSHMTYMSPSTHRTAPHAKNTCAVSLCSNICRKLVTTLSLRFQYFFYYYYYHQTFQLTWHTPSFIIEHVVSPKNICSQCSTDERGWSASFSSTTDGNQNKSTTTSRYDPQHTASHCAMYGITWAGETVRMRPTGCLSHRPLHQVALCHIHVIVVNTPPVWRNGPG